MGVLVAPLGRKICSFVSENRKSCRVFLKCKKLMEISVTIILHSVVSTLCNLSQNYYSWFPLSCPCKKMGNGKVTVIYKVTAIYICRKYKAIENFGRLSGDLYIQGRYIQIWIYLICTGALNGKFWDNKAWIKLSEAILSILGNCWEKCICSSLPVKLMKEFRANKVHLQPAIWLTGKFSRRRMSRPYWPVWVWSQGKIDPFSWRGGGGRGFW